MEILSKALSTVTPALDTRNPTLLTSYGCRQKAIPSPLKHGRTNTAFKRKAKMLLIYYCLSSYKISHTTRSSMAVFSYG